MCVCMLYMCLSNFVDGRACLSAYIHVLPLHRFDSGVGTCVTLKSDSVSMFECIKQCVMLNI